MLGLIQDVNSLQAANGTPVGQNQIPVLLRAASVAHGLVTVYLLVFLIIG